MNASNARLSEVHAYFQNGDIHLGYRRLLDAAIETGDLPIFEDTLHFCDWYDQWLEQKQEVAVLQEQVIQLLEKIGQIHVPVFSPTLKLKAEGIAKQYRRGRFALSSLDVELYTAQIIGLVGENGNGKTTLLRLLFGELLPDKGKIEYYLSDPATSFYDVRPRLAFIPQRPKTWYGPLMHNLQYTSTCCGRKGKENYLWTEMMVARMGLRPFRNYTWSRISSGYKMRFELARTLLAQPEILLLDEPLANLDILAQQIILEDLKYLAQSRTRPLSIILSSQQLYEVEKVSEQVIFLQRGVAKFQRTRQQEAAEAVTTGHSLVVELETSAGRDILQQLFETTGLQRISFNGGVYILYFDERISIGDVLLKLGNAHLPVQYFRDISSSSRRFFDA